MPFCYSPSLCFQIIHKQVQLGIMHEQGWHQCFDQQAYTGSRAGKLYDLVQYIKRDAAADRAFLKFLAEALAGMRRSKP